MTRHKDHTGQPREDELQVGQLQKLPLPPPLFSHLVHNPRGAPGGGGIEQTTPLPTAHGDP